MFVCVCSAIRVKSQEGAEKEERYDSRNNMREYGHPSQSPSECRGQSFQHTITSYVYCANSVAMMNA